jgi:hypothetical protein
MGPELVALVLEQRRARPLWGPRRLALELVRRGVDPPPSKSAVYRCLVRAGVIDPVARRRRDEKWKRWERAAASDRSCVRVAEMASNTTQFP